MLKLSPSDFAFLWEGCKRCFYLKVVHGIRPPSMPMAAIFKKLEGLQMQYYDGRRTTEVLPGLPPGVIRCGEREVESEPLEADGLPAWYIYGKTDSLIEFDDGSWGILDFKTTSIGAEKGQKYGRQLNAYAYSLENPASKPRSAKGKAPGLKPITKIGILCFEPSELLHEPIGRHQVRGKVEWIEIPRDPNALLKSVTEMLKVLAGEVPAAGSSCDWCAYAALMKDGKFASAQAAPAEGGVKCPQCGSPMRQRTGKFGEFWGCTKYPTCRGTRPVEK